MNSLSPEERRILETGQLTSTLASGQAYQNLRSRQLVTETLGDYCRTTKLGQLILELETVTISVPDRVYNQQFLGRSNNE